MLLERQFRVVDQSAVVALPLKEGQSADIPVLPGMCDIVKTEGRLRPFERAQQRTAEQAVSLAPRGRVQQQTAERMVGPASTAELRRGYNRATSLTHFRKGLDDKGLQLNHHEVRIHRSHTPCLGHPPARGPDRMEGSTGRRFRSPRLPRPPTNSKKTGPRQESRPQTRPPPASNHRPRPPSLLPPLVPYQQPRPHGSLDSLLLPLRPENADFPQELSRRLQVVITQEAWLRAQASTKNGGFCVMEPVLQPSAAFFGLKQQHRLPLQQPPGRVQRHTTQTWPLLRRSSAATSERACQTARQSHLSNLCDAHTHTLVERDTQRDWISLEFHQVPKAGAPHFEWDADVARADLQHRIRVPFRGQGTERLVSSSPRSILRSRRSLPMCKRP